MIELRSPAELERMRVAGEFVGSVLTATAAASDVGVNLLELDALAHDMIRERGAESCYIDYHPSFGGSPFGKVICTSVNDAALHGLPHDYRLQDGDVLTLDFAASVDGWVSDSAITLIVGTPRPQDERLIEVTSRALDAGVAAAVVGVIGATLLQLGWATALRVSSPAAGLAIFGSAVAAVTGLRGKWLVPLLVIAAGGAGWLLDP